VNKNPLPPNTGGEKLDPETLVLRGSPRPVVRFRRGVMITIAAGVSAAIIGVTWMALQPPSFRLLSSPDLEADPDRDRSREALAEAPRTYGDIPQLGPPLPGDLGKPMLDEQRRLSAGSEAGGDVEDMRRRRSARESSMLLRLSQRASEGAKDNEPLETASVPSDGGVALAVGGQQHKQQFLVTLDRSGSLNPHALEPAASPLILSAGSVIAAALLTGLNSDLPGPVTAQVTENVYDSPTGRTLLIPQGARLTGRYDSDVAFGQRRALVVWQRIMLPDGSSVRVDNWQALDGAGQAGLEDKVDFHTGRLLKGIALSTLLGVGTELSFRRDESELVRAFRESAQQNAAQAGQQIVSRNLEIQPTITIRPGWPLRVMVQKDLVLQPWKQN
jgi:type IV secretory pathway VirB10-like protein